MDVGDPTTNDRLYARKGTALIPLIPRRKSWKRFENITSHRQVIDLITRASQVISINEPSRSDTISDGKILRAGLLQKHEQQLRHALTIKVEVGGGTSQFQTDICHVASVQGITGDHIFEALLGCNGSGGTLEISISTIKPFHRHRVYSVSFDTSSRGGPELSDHQRVRIPLNINAEEASVTLRVRDNRQSRASQGTETNVLLISNPVLRQARGKRTGATITMPREAKLKDSNGAPRDTVFFTGTVPPFSSSEDEPLLLELQNTRPLELFAPDQSSITLLENWQHSFTAKANRDNRFSLFVNGEACQLLELGPEPNTINLPTRWLRGEPVEAQVRDLSGSQIYLSLPMLAPRSLTPEDVLLHEIRRPFPTDLTVRANHRYQALREHLRRPIAGITPAMLTQALETLDGDYSTVELLPLAFPFVAEPDVSVVIPAHDKVEVTYYSLCSLLLAHNAASFEVILVDDGSTDETAAVEEIVSGITVIHNEKPERFIKACNRGVREARGRFVVLLNNDTEVTMGWLDALVDAFSRFERVGAVGSKLVYPDGTLQDAGGIVWGSGNPWNYGNGHNPWDPRFSYARQADYLSGAALMTTKEIWAEVGGLSSYLEPMYFEDTDFSFKVRAAGYKTYFVPASVVYHFEGTTSGTDSSSGFKQYQEVNRPKFKRRWAKAFASHGKEGEFPDLEKDRGIAGRVLFIDYTTPQEDKDAGSYAAIREIELVQALGYKVTFLPQNLAYFGPYTEELQRKGVEVIVAPFHRSLSDYLKKHAREFDAVYITRYFVAADTVHLIRDYSPNTRIILNNADLHFLRELRAALSGNDEARMEAMRDIRNEELAMMQKVDLVLSYNEVEHTVISSHTDGRVKVMTCPWVADSPREVAPLVGREGLSFLGSFRHHPNAEGVQWFCREVMPRLEQQQLKLSIYGSGMVDDIKALASDWVDPVGYIDAVADAYQRHRVFVAPLLSGAGIKGKVLNALAYGIPTVLTPTAAEGIGLRHGHDCLIAKTPDEWVEAIRKLNSDDDLWSDISRAARSYASSQFSFAAGKDKMKAAFESVDLFSHLDG
ncbi:MULTISPECIES: glycosyltransferase [Aphanothece]|uniref:glycosyltransferase n=1 Tax=Aphanothece TaxID=1121 RepID=UPI003984FEB9